MDIMAGQQVYFNLTAMTFINMIVCLIGLELEKNYHWYTCTILQDNFDL